MLFLLQADESRYGQLFEELSKADPVGRDEYSETVKGAYELLVRTSRHFGGIILKGGRRNYKSERRCGGITSIMFMQSRRICD